MAADLVERLTSLSGPVVYLGVGAFALLETAAMAGLAVPGETAVVLGGVIASQGGVSLPWVATAAVVGAVLGDSMGFLLGRRVGTRLLRGRLARFVGRDRVERAMGKLRAGGMRSVLLGRFVGVIRAVMPFAAGSSGMSYPRFLVASILGSTIWGIAFTLVGYLAGSSWRTVERFAGRASTVIAVLIVITVVIVIGARRAAERQDRIQAWWQRQINRPRIAAVRRRYSGELGFLANRFRPGTAVGLQLTIALVGLAVLSSLLAVVVGQVLDSGPLVAADRSVHDALVRSHTPLAVDVMDRVHAALSSVGAAVFAAVTGVVLWVMDRRPRALIVFLVSAVGAALLVVVVRDLVARPADLFTVDRVRPTFPSGDLTVVAAVVMTTLVVFVPRLHRWTRKVALTAAGVATVVVAALAALYLGEQLLSDAVAGIVLGGLWAVVVTTVVATMWRVTPDEEVPAAGNVGTPDAPVGAHRALRPNEETDVR